MTPVRRARLENVPGWIWDRRGDQWETALGHLTAFVEREGHARVPQLHVEGDFMLGRWVSKQREAR